MTGINQKCHDWNKTKLLRHQWNKIKQLYHDMNKIYTYIYFLLADPHNLFTEQQGNYLSFVEESGHHPVGETKLTTFQQKKSFQKSFLEEARG